MKRVRFALSLSLSMLLIATSCDDLFDLKENPKQFIAPSGYYNTTAQIETVLSGCMASLYYKWGGYAYNPSLHQHDDHKSGGNLIIPLNHGSAIYAAHFANIKDINFALASIGKLEDGGTSQTVIDELVGQLKFLRAWNYFQLVRMWGGMPILTENNIDEYFKLLPSRASVAETYAFILSDFQEAEAKLPPSWPLFGRPTKYAAKALMAKAHLTMATYPLNETSNYAKAASLAKEVIDSGIFSLMTDITKVFSKEGEDGPEMIWSFVANDQYSVTTSYVWSPTYGWGDNSVDQIWVDSVYVDQPRKYAYLETHNREGVPVKDLGKAVGVRKYLYDMENFDRHISTINMPIIRYADVLLIFAEAENMSKGGPTPEAVTAINSVIHRANGNQPNPEYPLLTTSMTQQAFDTAVIFERGLELCFEYDRWHDIIRKRILYEVSREEYQPNFKEESYLFPIPESDVRLNPNMKQNPGYFTGN